MKHEGHSAGRELYVATSAICNRAVTVMVLANHNRAFGLYLPAPLQRVAYLSEGAWIQGKNRNCGVCS